ncbi:uncharacterized protein LOC123690444 [Pieris rapae]|uniref:uncharacterized protein LOC123690444 n=1 Tax=Pieris rapae TaxID=64459 RepID=UPI001E280AEF|nr:uncharacterized protein LOC123690444 [Pieris rapae]
MALSAATQEAMWLRQLHCELWPSLKVTPITLYCDNQSAIKLTEDIEESPSVVSTEDQYCLELYKQTTLRQANGRYKVRLPLKENFKQSLGLSKPTAVAQFHSLERKLAQQPKTAGQYKDFINEYKDLGHMSLVENKGSEHGYYLPHHCVTREHSETTKLRVVFNGSAKTSTGLSLNDVMYTGPNLQQDLQSLILKWRRFRYVYTADVEKMFRNIDIFECDRKMQKIIWRDTHLQPLQEYELTTVTYGTKAAPFLAMMTLKQLAMDERSRFPRAAEITEQAFYTDDLIYGAHSIEEGCSMLFSKVKTCLGNNNIKCYGWTDSMVTLGWIQGQPEKWKPFVSNRVKQIVQDMPPNIWRYVKSEENPADCASRGISIKRLEGHSLWWNGPSWLPSYKHSEETQLYFTKEEEKKQYLVNIIQSKDSIVKEIIENCSSFSRAIRIVAWILRLLPKNKDKRERHLTLAEVKEAKLKIISHVQEEEFSYEIEKVKRKESIHKSKLIALNPFLGKDGLVRVGGRLRNAFISEDMQHPILISHTGRLTNLIIDQAHKLTFHGGPRLTLSLIRQKYWIVGNNRAVKRQLSKWQRPRENLKVQDLVAIHDPNLPPGKWAMGRVVELHPGTDNIVRVVSLKTKNGIIKRPIHRSNKRTC